MFQSTIFHKKKPELTPEWGVQGIPHKDTLRCRSLAQYPAHCGYCLGTLGQDPPKEVAVFLILHDSVIEVQQEGMLIPWVGEKGRAREK